jgi:topoisomerase-4 subunit B
MFNGKAMRSANGLLDMLDEKMTEPGIYPFIHLKDADFEIAFTHTSQYGEEYYTFVNGQHTTQGGTHLVAFRESFVKTIREFYNKDFNVSDIRQGIAAAVSIKIEDPIFESQTKTRLGSKDMEPNGVSINKYVNDFVKQHLDNYLHKNLNIADIIQKKILDSEKDRKAISGIQKLAKERAKKVSLHNENLRDCRIHYNSDDERRLESSIFITEGNSASGSITKARDVLCQAVFSLRGKPLNTYGLTRKVVYENKEFNLLQAALNIEESMEDLRYNHVIIATDADVDGMHIRLLLITFFLQFFPELVKNGHLYILQTPLFRVRNKKKTAYCYTEDERLKAIKDLGPNPEITRFKGLGEISPDEFKGFINKNIRLELVRMKKEDAAKELLDFYMGKNTPKRQNFIIDNLIVDEEML